jgi:hypothetical protein
MRGSKICTLAKNYYGYEIKEDEMSRECSKHGEMMRNGHKIFVQ